MHTETVLETNDIDTVVAARAGDTLGYAPVSTNDQNLDAQRARLTEAGAIRVFTDIVSGRNAGEINAKYGPDPGLKIYSFLSGSYGSFHSNVIGATAGEAPFVLDGPFGGDRADGSVAGLRLTGKPTTVASGPSRTRSTPEPAVSRATSGSSPAGCPRRSGLPASAPRRGESPSPSSC